MTAGEDFVKWLRPAGCALFLGILILVLIICFSSGRDPIPGYAPPHDTAYYAQSAETMEELKAELEENVFPQLEGVLQCEARGGVLEIQINSEHFAVTRAAILRYYDSSLFEFTRG